MGQFFSFNEAILEGENEYVWPWKYDYLEDLLVLKSGYFVNVFSDETRPCSFGQSSLGRQNAAEWIRTAFHDLITHNTSSGEGGLDASIIFELNRGGNVDTRPIFETTLHFMSLFHTPRSSIADLLALGVYTSLANCGGPRLPFRAGRLDATEADASGVLTPQPHQDLESHKSIFSRAGFSDTEMISLVACGHTLGGVHTAYFPHIVGTVEFPKDGAKEPSSNLDVVHFEESPGSSANFDNTIVLEYLSGTGSNPLVHSHNETFRSDKRIFSSDQNETVRTLSNQANFMERCKDVFGRMLDLVPRDKGIKLTAPIKPVDVKPYIREQSIDPSGSIRFSGRIRVRVGPATGRNADDLEVELSIVNRNATRTIPIRAVRGKRSGGISSGHFGDAFVWFEFSTTVPSSVGIKSFNVLLIQQSTGDVEVHDNLGRGFPASDVLLYQPRQSCLDSVVKDGKINLRVVAAVHDETGPAGAPTLNLFHKVPREDVTVPALEATTIPFQSTAMMYGAYRIFQADTALDLASWNTRFDVVSNSEIKVEFLPTNVLRSASNCKPL
ncbi:putative WSC domain-containing protein [Seiridium cardinale]